MSYQIQYTKKALLHLDHWIKSGQKKTVTKIYQLLEELTQHPMTGTGQVEQLRGDYSGYWSRRIDKGNRLVYTIDGNHVIVTIVSLRGHYD